MTKRIIKIDASSLKKSACGLQFYYQVVEGYRQKQLNNDICFGVAFHIYVAVMKRTGGNFKEATEATLKYFRGADMIIKSNKRYMTENYLLKTCQDYWFQRGNNDDFVTLNDEQGKPLVELGFQWPIYEDPELAVLVAGTIDDLCKHKRGAYALRDYKTTSMWDKKAYLDQYYLSSQLMIYRLTVRKYAAMYPQSIFAELEQKNVHCFIEGIFCSGADKPIEFQRSDVFQFGESQLNDLETLLRLATLKLVTNIKAGKLPLREGMINDACSGKFGSPCEFFDACRAPDLISAKHILTRNFIQKPYDPLSFNE